jgi:hypothetical protein
LFQFYASKSRAPLLFFTSGQILFNGVRKWRNSTTTFFLLPSVRPHGTIQRITMKFDTGDFLENLSGKNPVSSKSEKNNGYFS